MAQLNSVHIFTPYVSKIHFNITLNLHLGKANGLVHQDFATEFLSAFLISAICLLHSLLFNHRNSTGQILSF